MTFSIKTKFQERVKEPLKAIQFPRCEVDTKGMFGRKV